MSAPNEWPPQGAEPRAFPARSYDFAPYEPCRNFIGGVFQDAASGESLEVENPRHGRAIGKVAMSGAADAGAAVQAAHAAWPRWRATPIKERAEVLYRLKYAMQRDLDELAWLVSHENGKTFDESRASVQKGIECIEFAAGVPNSSAGGFLEVSRGVTCKLVYEPLGVVAGIVPFNFPLMVPLWMIPLALVAGNAMVMKPSEKVPYGLMRLAQLLRESGLPDGVFNTVNGGQEASQALVDHPLVQAVAFVGSTRVARSLYQRGTALGKRMLCLGGAKNHLIVVPDADLELTASNVVASAFGCAGQRCMAASVLVAVGDVDHVVAAIADKARAIRLGTDLGPVIDRAAVERITRFVDEAERMGARVLVDGRGAAVEGSEGHWFGPTVLDNVRPDMPAGCDEIFGPVLSIVRARTLDEAIAIENASPYGNAACIYTTTGAIAEYAIERFESGMCGVNIGVPVPREPFSFGGWGDSRFGEGDITGTDGYRFWSRARKVTAKWALQRDSNWMS